MARYGMDYGRNFDRNFDRQGGMGWNEGGWGAQRGAWGEENGFAGGYDAGYGGGQQEWGPRTVGGRFFGGGGGYGRDYMGGSGYGGRDAGYQSGMSGGYGMGDMEMGRGGAQRGSSRSRTRAAELMTENPECVTPDATLADVARRMRDLDVGIIPVVEDMEGRRLRGVITDRDITVRAVAEGKDGKAKVADCMTSRVETVNKNDPVTQVLDLMSREQVRRVPVTDREGRLVGIIAQADLALDYGDTPRQDMRVEKTIERISEPTGNRGGMAARGRGRQGAGEDETRR